MATVRCTLPGRTAALAKASRPRAARRARPAALGRTLTVHAVAVARPSFSAAS
eukprot:CAMPEP_0183789802 /NCGR_PEP_ID=MMETSP0803_2-20130417/650_1 /TAXON_ID=195967 /ORGANISM="Crustomastix stigmata, Strain CCMP3273" /LENGTH=52 /DNA_ID=CAMNT_0026033983 /DNA_START=31 /DNA_END=186 /DNA_ORIENTATION=+